MDEDDLRARGSLRFVKGRLPDYLYKRKERRAKRAGQKRFCQLCPQYRPGESPRALSIYNTSKICFSCARVRRKEKYG